ncbi:MAG: hypothetical protein P8N51_15795 [Pseudomonadales bacterium]|nr:hypothetical protein [Pseudomonadales bacterium]
MQHRQDQHKQHKQHKQKQKQIWPPLLVLAPILLFGSTQVVADNSTANTIFFSVNVQPQLVDFQQVAQQNTMPANCNELLGGTAYPGTRTCQDASTRYTWLRDGEDLNLTVEPI